MPVLTRDDPPAKVAAAVLDYFTANPTVHHQAQWFGARYEYSDGDVVVCFPDAVEAFPVDEPPPCGTTVCAAGAVAHLLGYTLNYNSYGRLGEDITDTSVGLLPSDSPLVAGPALGLLSTPATRLFFGSTNEQAIASLRAIADGIDPNDAVRAAIPRAQYDS